MRFLAAPQTISSFLGAHRWERACATRAARRLASANVALPQRAGFSACAFSCAAFRRDGDAHMRGRTAPLLLLQRRSDYRLSSLDRNAPFCRTIFHARSAIVGKYHRFSLPGKRNSTEGLRAMGHPDPQTGGTLGGTLRRGRGAQVVF